MTFFPPYSPLCARPRLPLTIEASPAGTMEQDIMLRLRTAVFRTVRTPYRIHHRRNSIALEVMQSSEGKTDFKKLRVKRLPRAPVRETAEHRYWGHLKVYTFAR